MLLAVLRKDMMIARKEHDDVKSALLATLVSEAAMVGKNAGNRESTNEEVLFTLRKFIKNIDEMIEICKTEGRTYEKAARERSILEQYLPEQMTDEELDSAIEALLSALPEKNPKMMGKIMSQLKEKYNGLYDGKKASELVKIKLT